MLRARIVISTLWLLFLAGFFCPSDATAQAVVPVSFATTNAMPLNPGFAGFCTEMLTNAVEYYDTNFQQITATLSPGWLRYPGGALEDAFEWTNGVTMTNWISEFPAGRNQFAERHGGNSCPAKAGRCSATSRRCARMWAARRLSSASTASRTRRIPPARLPRTP